MSERTLPGQKIFINIHPLIDLSCPERFLMPVFNGLDSSFDNHSRPRLDSCSALMSKNKNIRTLFSGRKRIFSAFPIYSLCTRLICSIAIFQFDGNEGEKWLPLFQERNPHEKVQIEKGINLTII